MRDRTTADWAVPALCLVLGVVFLAAGIVGGQPSVGVASFVAMLVYAAILTIAGTRSDIVSVLRGQPTDERYAAFTLQATATAGTVAIVVALGAYVWEIANGRDGMAYVLVLVPTAIAFFASLVWQRARS